MRCPGEKLTASANNDNLRSHFGRCNAKKGRESVPDANAGRKVRRWEPLYGRWQFPAPSRCRGYVEKVRECASVSVSGSPQCKRACQPVNCALFVGWGWASRASSVDSCAARVGFRYAALMSSHVKMQDSVVYHMTTVLRRCGWLETAPTHAGI